MQDRAGGVGIVQRWSGIVQIFRVLPQNKCKAFARLITILPPPPARHVAAASTRPAGDSNNAWEKGSWNFVANLRWPVGTSLHLPVWRLQAWGRRVGFPAAQCQPQPRRTTMSATRTTLPPYLRALGPPRTAERKQKKD